MEYKFMTQLETHIHNSCFKLYYTMLILNFLVKLGDESGNDDDCSGSVYCPPECQCQGTAVRCSRAHLTQIPRGIPPDTTEL